MNEPALTARQYAAYDRAVFLFSNNLFSFSPNQRSKLYDFVLKLLSIAIQARSSLPTRIKNQTEKDSIIQYLLLLKDTIKAAHALVAHEMILFQEEKQLSSFIGPDLSSQIRSTDEIFTNSELNIYHCAKDLIEMAAPSIIRLRERTKKSFNHEDITRFNKTLKEFQKLYDSFGAGVKDES